MGSGSGSTLAAAALTGRQYIGVEIDPKYCRIAQKKVQDALKTRLAGLQIEISFDESAAERISIDGFDPAYGARPLRRAIQSNIEDKLADELLHGKFKAGDKITCTWQNEQYTFS